MNIFFAMLVTFVHPKLGKTTLEGRRGKFFAIVFGFCVYEPPTWLLSNLGELWMVVATAMWG